MLNSTPVIKSQVMQRISQAPAAKVWMPVDFLDLGSRDAVDKTLQRMVADNGLRRVDRGLYDQPRVNGLPAVPDYLSVIDAVGRRDQVRVQTVMIERDGSATIAADRSWSPLPTAAVGFVASPQHHQNLTPNPSRLGVFICASRISRGAPAHSACASGVLWPGRKIPGYPPFRPLPSSCLEIGSTLLTGSG